MKKMACHECKTTGRIKPNVGTSYECPKCDGKGHYMVAEESEIHPAPAEFTDEQLNTDPILRYFHYAHLPPKLQGVSKGFFALAKFIIDTCPRNAERTVALRKLLEAKDAAVRSNV